MQTAVKTKIVYSEKCLGYGTWHIEGPQRVKLAHEVLKAKGYEFVEPQSASEDEILSIHDMEYIRNLKKGLVEDSDTPAYDRISHASRLEALYLPVESAASPFYARRVTTSGNMAPHWGFTRVVSAT